MNTSPVVIIGTGNLAEHLIKVFLSNKVVLAGIIGRNKKRLEKLKNLYHLNILSSYENILSGSLAIVCVSDDAIAEVVCKIPETISVAYTSGSFELTNLHPRKNIGVFYPLQTFGQQTEILNGDIPFFIEGSSIEVEQMLSDLAKKISHNVIIADSETRAHYHLAAVFANNFVNHLLAISSDYLKEKNLSFEYLLPLIEQTLINVKTLPPGLIQTGPAIRNDEKIIEKQLKELQGHQQLIYKIITESIQNKHLSK